MNVWALCLEYASLVTAGFVTPGPEKHNSKDDVTVKEGVVIGFEKDDGNTKVSISPHEVESQKGYVAGAEEKLEKAKERLEEASSSVLPEVMSKGESANPEEETHPRFWPGEVVCDAYGKCKEKIESYMGRTKEAMEKKAHEVEEEAKEAVSEAIGKVKDTVARTAHMASGKARETKESIKDAASEVSGKAKDKAAEKAGEMKQGAKEKVREKGKEAEEVVKSASDRAKHDALGAKREGKKGLKGILRRAGGVFRYMVPPVRMASVTSVLHLLGFAAAYGMCVWVTFASNYVLAGALPRHQFAMVQSKIYPVYFKAMACGVGTALLGHMMGHRKRFPPLGTGMFRGYNLMASLVMVLVNLLYLEPRATKVMFERMKKEKEEGSGKEGEPRGSAVESTTEPAAGLGTTGGPTTPEEAAIAAAKPQNVRSNGTLRRLNSYSSLLNVVTLMSLTWHLVHLGQHLHAVC